MRIFLWFSITVGFIKWFDRLFWIILGCCVYCCYPCAVYRDAEDLNKSGVLYGFLACLFPCIPTFLLRGETREKYGIEVKMHIVWKSPKMSHLSFPILAFSTNFCQIKTDLYGNNVRPKAIGFQKVTIFGIFNELLSV